MPRTSRLRRRLHVVEPKPDWHGPGVCLPVQLPIQEPTPVGDSEVPQPPDGADDADQAADDLDAISTGMSLLLRVALRLMRS
jgi:hypothetical protein